MGRTCCFWTSRSRASIRPVWPPSSSGCTRSPGRAARSSSPRTCSRPWSASARRWPLSPSPASWCGRETSARSTAMARFRTLVWQGDIGALDRDGTISHDGKEFRTLEQLFLRSEEHTSELQSPCNLVCRLLLEKKKKSKEKEKRRNTTDIDDQTHH